MVMSYNDRQLDIFPVNNFDSLIEFHFSLELQDFIDTMDSVCLPDGDDIME